MACCSSNEELLKEDLKKSKELTVALLKEKRALLLSLEKERRAVRRRDKELEGLLKQVGQRETSRSESDLLASGLERSPPKSSVSNTLLDCPSENAALLKRISISERDVRKARDEIRELEDQKLVLEAEVVRLAETLDRVTTGDMRDQLLHEQLHVYEEDFKKEKSEKQAAESRITTLEGAVRNYQDLLSTLTRELDTYKDAYEREKREKETALFQAAGTTALPASGPHSLPEEYSASETASLSSAPHLLQVVYPVVDSTDKELNKQRKRQLSKVGVSARNSNSADGLFHGTER